MKRSKLKTRPRDAGDALPSLEDALPAFSMELARARRYERPLSAISAPQSVLVNNRVPLRVTDVAAQIAGGRFIALLIETGREDAEALAERIRRESQAHDVRVASFPEDALTLDDLIGEVV